MKARRILSAVIAAVMTVAAIPAGVSAAEYKEGYYTYTVSDGDATITKVNPIISGDVVVPETLGGNKVFAIGKNAFKDCTKMTSVDIAESVKKIGAYAFYNCTGLTKITIPYNVRSIDDYAFANCVKVTELNYNVEAELSWDDYLYADDACGVFDEIGAESTGVTVNFGEKVTKVPDYMFNYPVGEYDEGENVVTLNFLGSNIETIGAYAFENLKTLKTVKSKGETVTEGTLSIPDSVTTIGAYSFMNCEGVEKITIPSGVKTIDDYAFADCVNVIELNYNVEAELTWDDYFYADDACGVFDEIGAESTGVTVNFGEKVTKVPDYMFNYPVGEYDEGENIVTVNFLGSNVGTIGESAFSNVKTLKTVKSKGEAVSEGTLSIPESVITIGANSFCNCDGIEIVTISSGVETIGASAFQKCEELKTITIPYNVKTIDDYAFADCVNVIELNYNVEAELTWDDYFYADDACGVFDEIGAESTGVTVNFGEKVTKVPDYMFSYEVGTYDEGENVKEVHFLGSNAVTVGESAFNGIETLTDVYVAGSVLRWAEFEIYENNEPLLNAELHLISSGVTGDSNNDGKTNMFDATVMLQNIAGWSIPVNTDGADVTGDGKVNLMDVTLILQYIAGWDVVLK